MEAVYCAQNEKRGMRMELPKNIVQIGKPDRTHKIFVEDYVVSYIKQLNRECGGKPIGMALYGKYVEEDDCKYYFLYGAARVEGIEHRGPYLSQAEQEEIEDIGKRYFDEYQFLAWCSLRGEPVEGFFVRVQGKGMQVDGYACFYEKNECMLNFMLMNGRDSRTVQGAENSQVQSTGRGEWTTEDIRKNLPVNPPPTVKRAEVVPMPAEANRKSSVAKRTEYMKVAVAAVFLVLCVVGITTLNDYEKLEDLQAAARQVIAGLTEQKLPDASGEDILTAGISANDISANSVLSGNIPTTNPVEMTGETMATNEPTATGEPAATNKSTATGEPAATNEPVETPEQVQTVTESVPIAYTIAKGDTLISICNQKYGSLERFSEICELNGITNPDSIQIGQTILLPQ